MSEETVGVEASLLYHFCRLRLPAVALPLTAFSQHLERGFALWRTVRTRDGLTAVWGTYLTDLHALDFFLSSACLESLARAWEALFASRASRSDCLLVDALRARAVRLFPHNEARQEEAVGEFWGFLLAGQRDGSPPILARYDGQRPLVPWLIRVFQNKHLSQLRQHRPEQALPDDDLTEPRQQEGYQTEERWHEEFRQAARDWLQGLKNNEVLILGLRLRYRLSQREVARILGIHEGNVGRQTDKLSQHCQEQIGARLQQAGWTGDDLSGFIRKEMDSVLLDEPRLAADRLAALLASSGRTLPPLPADAEAGDP
jgi:RNA polymerase sigma factor (sigma-70 family)